MEVCLEVVAHARNVGLWHVMVCDRSFNAQATEASELELLPRSLHHASIGETDVANLDKQFWEKWKILPLYKFGSSSLASSF